MRKTVFVFFPLWIFITVSFGQVTLGEKVPNFTATDQDGSKWGLTRNLRSADYLVIYFYPAAFTGGCTKQACAYRDQKAELEKVKASVVGISGDKPETLELFALQNQLNFTLLSDEKGEIARMFGVPQNPGGSIEHDINGENLRLERGTTIQRWTFILARKGTLIYKDSEVNATEDSGRVVEFLSSIEN